MSELQGRRPRRLPAAVAADEHLLHDAGWLVRMAIEEDVGTGDVTTRGCVPEELTAKAEIIVRQEGVVAGLWMLDVVYGELGGNVEVASKACDGDVVRQGQRLATVSGTGAAILRGERVALNFLQRLCGVATLTRAYVEAVAGTRAAICDTRKTTPGWRRLEKYAVRCGGGVNHRMGLYDQVLIKDNHLALTGQDVAAAVTAVRRRVGAAMTVELEVETLEQLEKALPLAVDMILLDNMAVSELRRAVTMRDRLRPGGPPLLEASGGINLQTVKAVAETGVDRISLGAITHSAAALDIALGFLGRPGPCG